MPVRVAVPDYRGPLKDVLAAPKYATAIGLLMHGRDQLASRRCCVAASPAAGMLRSCGMRLVCSVSVMTVGRMSRKVT